MIAGIPSTGPVSIDMHCKWVLLISYVVFDLARATDYEPLDTAFLINTNPRVAEVGRSIRCQGPLPKWKLPVIPPYKLSPGWDPNKETSLQRICAHPQYGGAYHRGYTLAMKDTGHPGTRKYIDGWWSGVGLFCLGPLDSPSPALAQIPSLVQLNNDVFRTITTPELELYCRSRCWCNNPNGPVDSPPKGYPENALVQERSGFNFETIRIHDPNFVSRYPGYSGKSTAFLDYTAQATLLSVIQMRAWYVDDEFQSPGWHVDSMIFEKKVKMWEGNQLTCQDGPPPSDFYVPEPYHIQDFPTNTRLCAVSLSGGDPGANAGGYCDPGGWYGVEPDVWFSDEYTPRLEWTWNVDYEFSAGIRSYCWTVCSCTNRRMPKKRPADAFFRITDQAVITQLPYGFKIDNPSKSGQSSSNDLGSSCPSSSCLTGYNNGPHVPKPWPINVLGPAPGPRPPKIQSRPLSRPALAQCGQACSGPASQQCSGYANDQSCKCMHVSKQIAQIYNVEYGLSRFMCLAATQLAKWYLDPQSCNARDGGSCPFRLGGRSVEDNTPSVHRTHRSYYDVTIQCPCNASYVSQACCNSDNGLIWEDPVHNALMGGTLGDVRK